MQEEIRFSVCPLATVALLLCPMMEDHEAIIITGCEQFSSYKGYAFSLRFGGDYIDPQARDDENTVLDDIWRGAGGQKKKNESESESEKRAKNQWRTTLH